MATMSEWIYLESPGVKYWEDDTDYYVPPKPELTDEEQQWLNLLRDSKGKPGLTELVEQCKMYHILGKE